MLISGEVITLLIPIHLCLFSFYRSPVKYSVFCFSFKAVMSSDVFPTTVYPIFLKIAIGGCFLIFIAKLGIEKSQNFNTK